MVLGATIKCGDEIYDVRKTNGRRSVKKTTTREEAESVGMTDLFSGTAGDFAARHPYITAGPITYGIMYFQGSFDNSILDSALGRKKPRT